MTKLTPEQENYIGDLQHHEKKLNKRIPMNPKRFDLIKKKVGRKKFDVNETYSDIQGKIDRE